MNILVINAGSSSLKYQLIDMQHEAILAKGVAERIGIQGSNLRHSAMEKPPIDMSVPMANHTQAIEQVLSALVHPVHGAVQSMDNIHAVGHRVVHGGEQFSHSTLIDETVIAAIEQNSDLAPLHNPANLMGIRACRSVMPHTPMVAVFDTAFHQTMPPKAFLYALPYEAYTDYKIRRYGFHGTSHRFVSQRAAQLMGKPIEQLKIITCHLGNGSSITAVDGGKSVDTSMGLTPLEGIMMGTRCGDIDPSIIEYLMKKKNISIDEVSEILNRKSGLLGISGVSSDMRDIKEAIAAGNERAEMAMHAFTYRIRKYIGSYAAAMNGVDCIVFTAGIGENIHRVRQDVLSGLGFLGVDFEEQRNDQSGKDYEITSDHSHVKAFVIATDEELVIARDTLALI